MENFSSQIAERHIKPEASILTSFLSNALIFQVEVRTSKELLLEPITISRNKYEKVLIEGAFVTLLHSFSF